MRVADRGPGIGQGSQAVQRLLGEEQACRATGLTQRLVLIVPSCPPLLLSRLGGHCSTPAQMAPQLACTFLQSPPRLDTDARGSC